MHIGYEYHLEFEKLCRVQGNIFDYLHDFHCVWMDCGRGPLKLFSRIIGSGEALLPDYMAQSVLDGFPPPLKMVYYHVEKDFSIDFIDLEKRITPQTRVIYVNNFFGRLPSERTVEQLLELKQKYGLILFEDTTQSLLSSPCTLGDYCAASLWKWFPAPDGGVLYSKEVIPSQYTDLLLPRVPPQKAYGMVLKTMQLRGEMDCRAKYDAIFETFEPELEQAESRLYKMSDFSRFLFGCCNVEEARKARISNMWYLLDKIQTPAIRPVYDDFGDDCPSMLALYVENRDSLKDYLWGQGIYCSVLWNLGNTVFKDNPASMDISRHILCLPIDQRYGVDEMNYIAESISSWSKTT